MNDLPDALNRLDSRLETLERRVYALEHPSAAASAVAAPEPVPFAGADTSAELSIAKTDVAAAGGAFPVLGKAMLGIAGAYLLRAVAESSALPQAAVAAVAIAYALAWLVWASRAKAGDWLAGTTYACTSAMILAPMLWELTLRFKVLSAPVTAGVVCGFVIAASALAWKRDFAPVLWVANGTGAAIALTLGIASHQMTPFIWVLLLMMLIGELGAGRARGYGLRVLVALAADVAMWALIYIYASPQSTRSDYPELGMGALLAPGIALFAICGGGLIYRTVLKRKTITVFETIQAMIAFLVAACSLIYFGPPASGVALGVFCVGLSGASYAATFARFDGMAERRNYLVFAMWSGALFLAGCLLCVAILWQPVWLGIAAIATTVLGARRDRTALELHGVVFLLTAAGISGLLSEVASALAGANAGAPGWGIYLVSACTILCYAALRPRQEEPWTGQALAIVLALLATGAAAALLVQGLVSLIAMKVIPGAHHLAFIRTFTVCAAAIGLGYSGAHWRRMELTRIGYATLALLAVKLVFEDLRHGHLGYIAASIFLFAITLIVVPRVARLGQRV